MAQTTDPTALRALIDEARTSGKWSRDAIDALIKTNDKAVERAVLRIYELQTEYEKRAETTVEANGVGFSALDADIFSSFAKQLREGRTLSPKQLALARKPSKTGYARLSKYHAQLIKFIGGKS